MKEYQNSVEHGEALLDGPRPSNAADARLWDLANKGRILAAKRAQTKLEALEEGDPASIKVVEEANPQTDVEPPPLTVQRSLPLEARLRTAARDIQNFDSAGSFDTFPLSPQNEFPTSLTRLPIFRPSQRRKQQSIQDLDNAVSFDTPFGSGRRLGPPLTIRDEDTLIALMRLRDHALAGPDHALPASVRDIYQPKNGVTEIHRVVCTIDQINTELGLSDSGTNFKNTLASIKRLNASKIEFDKIVTDGSRVGGAFDLVKVQWHVYERHGLVDVIFPPLMAHWLRHSYTYIDWGVRRELTSLGKAIHRYLSGQSHEYTIGLKKLANTIGFDGRQEHMKRKFSDALDEMIEIGWLAEYEFRGSGRLKPVILRTVKCRKST